MGALRWHAQVSKNDEFCIKNRKLSIKNEKLCVENEKICTKNGETATELSAATGISEVMVPSFTVGDIRLLRSKLIAHVDTSDASSGSFLPREELSAVLSNLAADTARPGACFSIVLGCFLSFYAVFNAKQ